MELFFAERADAVDDLLADGGVADNAPLADVVAAGFELGFDEGDGFAAGGKEAVEGREDEAQGDEGDIGDGQGGGLGEVAGFQVAGVAAVEDDDAGVGGESGVELAFADIDGEDLEGAMLEEAVREAARGGADVNADLAVGGEEGEAEEGLFELEAAAANEALGLADAQGAVRGILVAGFASGGVIDEDFAGEDEALGFFAAFGQAAFDEQEVEPSTFHFPTFLRAR